jgi:hypothetical protein
VVRLAGDSLVLRPRGGGPVVALVPPPAAQLYLYQGRRSLTARGAVIGGLLGVAVGGLVGAFTSRGCSPAGVCSVSRRSRALERSAGFGGAGLAAGLVVGTVLSHDLWVRTWLFPAPEPALRLGFVLPR